MFYTYAHAKPNGTIFYIGKGKTKRAWDRNGRSEYWTRIVNKHGFEVQILANWKTEQEAFDHEILLISCFKDMGYELANHTDGVEYHSVGEAARKLGISQPSLSNWLNEKTKPKAKMNIFEYRWSK